MPAVMTPERAKSVKSMLTSAIGRSKQLLNHIKSLVLSGQIEKLGEDAVRKISENDRIHVRRFSLELASEMVGVSRHIISSAEAAGDLPEPDYRKDTNRRIRAGYTINQINDMRIHFKTLPEVDEAIKSSIISFLNLKGGCQKTTTTLFFAHWLAMKGYRVLCLDTDPQASLTEAFGFSPDSEINYQHTIAPFMLGDQDSLLEEGLDEHAFLNLRYAIRPTYWNRIDLIPGCLELLSIDLLGNRGKGNEVSVDKLRKGLKDVGVDYDFILIDGTPSLNLSTLSVIRATDQVFVPTPAEMTDYRSTVKFLKMLEDVLDSTERQNHPSIFPHFNFLVNKKTKTSYSDLMTNLIENTFNDPKTNVNLVLDKHIDSSNEVGRAAAEMSFLYEINAADSSNRDGLKKAERNYDEVFEELLETLNKNLNPDYVSVDLASNLNALNLEAANGENA